MSDLVNGASAEGALQKEALSDARDVAAKELSCDSTISSVIRFPGDTTTSVQEMDTESIARWTFTNE